MRIAVAAHSCQNLVFSFFLILTILNYLEWISLFWFSCLWWLKMWNIFSCVYLPFCKYSLAKHPFPIYIFAQILTVLDFTFNFDPFWVYLSICWRWMGSICLFSCGYTVVSVPFVEKTICYSLNYLGISAKNQLTTNVRVFSGFSVPLFFFFC